jgi:Tol biopolymer transport system component
VVQGWSPDGLLLVFARAQLHLVDQATKDVRTVTPQPTSIWAGTCRFSPDGRHVLFIGQNKDKQSTLGVVDLLLGKTKVLTTFTDKDVRVACWSPDGGHIAYSFTKLDDEGKRIREGGVEVIRASGGLPRVLIEDTEKGVTLTDWR